MGRLGYGALGLALWVAACGSSSWAMAIALASAIKSSVVARACSAPIAAGMHPGIAHGMRYVNFAPVLAWPEIARSFGLSPIGFETWARQRRGLG